MTTRTLHKLWSKSGQHPLKIQEITSQLVNRYTQIILSLTETTGMTRDRTGCQQTRFDERYNKQYSPNYNYNHYQPSPPVSVAGPDLSALH